MNPIKTPAALAVALLLSACGGGGRETTIVRSFATGPIHTACLRAGQRAANSALCGCVQASANSLLSRNEQARAVAFFRDPNLAQVTRQSDRPGDERFWLKYKQFVDVAERSCA